MSNYLSQRNDSTWLRSAEREPAMNREGRSRNRNRYRIQQARPIGYFSTCTGIKIVTQAHTYPLRENTSPKVVTANFFAPKRCTGCNSRRQDGRTTNSKYSPNYYSGFAGLRTTYGDRSGTRFRRSRRYTEGSPRCRLQLRPRCGGIRSPGCCSTAA